MMSTPYLKFISHISQFIIFLILITASALRDNHIPTGLGKKNIARKYLLPIPGFGKKLFLYFVYIFPALLQTPLVYVFNLSSVF